MKNLISLSRFLVLFVGLLTMCVAPMWGEDYSFTIQTSNFNTTSYAANNGSHDFTATCTTDAKKTKTVACTSNQVMQSSSVMQWQSGKGYIYNTTDLGTIKSVTVNSSAGSFTTNYGTSEHPTSGTTVGNGFFTVSVGDATGKTSSIVVVFEVSSNTPTITKSGTLSAFTATYGSASVEQTFQVGGSKLTTNITVSAPTNYEISKTTGTGFGSSVTLTKDGLGNVANTTLYIRLKNNVDAGSVAAASITCSSTGATDQSISIPASKVQSKVNWSVNGSAAAGSPTLAVDKAGKVSTLPTAPTSSDCDNSKVFVGWTDAQIASATDTKPSTLFTAASGAPAINVNEVTYYAVFATESAEGSAPVNINVEALSGNESGTFSVTCAANGGTAPVARTDFGNYVRLYANNKVTISTTGDDSMTQIVVTWSRNTKKDWAEAELTSGGGSYIDPSDPGNSEVVLVTGTWTGSAKSVVFTIGAGQKQIHSVAITTGGSTYTDYSTTCTAPTTWTVNYNANGKTITGDVPASVTDLDPASEFTVPTNNYLTETTRKYEQIGWNTNSGETEGLETIPAQEAGTKVTLYAIWREIDYTITVSEPTNGSITAPTNGSTAHMGDEVTVTVAPATGYSISEVKYNDGEDHPIVISANSGSFTMPAHAVTISATFSANVYSITYKDQGDETFSGSHESGKPTSHTYGVETVLKTATKSGYTFDGWYTSSDCTGEAVTTLGATDCTSEIVLYAKWTAKVDKYIDSMHGTAEYTGAGREMSGYYTIPTLEDDTSGSTECKTTHSKFIGWIAASNINTDGTLKADKEPFAGGSGKAATGATYYAVWAVVNE